jgi:hypothetical protein
MSRHSATKRRTAKASRSTGTRKAPIRKAPTRKASILKASTRKASPRKVHARPAARKPEQTNDIKITAIEISQITVNPAIVEERKASAVAVIASAMRSHKFRVGQTVFYTSSPISRPGASGSYKVVRLLPSDGDDYQYRIKHAGEAFERVAKESQLELES